MPTKYEKMMGRKLANSSKKLNYLCDYATKPYNHSLGHKVSKKSSITYYSSEFTILN